MSKPLFTNNAQGSLALGITATTTNIQLNAGAGSLFPQPSNIGEYFTLTLVSITDPTYFEIVECIARSVDMLTIVRAQEGTTAKSFNISDSVQLRITAASLNLFAAGGSTGVNASGSSVAEFTATQGQTVFTLPFTYVTGINNLVVFVNGSKQISASNYTESSTTSITFVSGLNAGDLVEVIYNLPLAGGTITASNVTYNEGGTGSVNRTVTSKLQETISALDFGVDPTGVNDSTTALQAAINAAVNKKLYIPSGTYKIQTLPLLVPSNITIYGDGIGRTTLKIANGATIPTSGAIFNNSNIPANVLNVSSLTLNTNITISDMTLDGNKANNGYSYGLYFVGVSNITVKNVRAQNTAGQGIQLNYTDKVQILNCETDSTNADGIQLADSMEYLIDGCKVTNSGDYGIEVDHGLFLVTQNISTGSGTISNNIVNTCVNYGIAIRGQINTNNPNNKPIVGAVIIGNHTTNCSAGICLQEAVESCVVDSNESYSNVHSGILCSPGVSAGITKNVSIKNNIIRDNANDGIQADSAVQMVIEGNIIVRNQYYGIYGSLGYSLIKGNNISGNCLSSSFNFSGIAVHDCTNTIMEGNFIYNEASTCAYAITELTSNCSNNDYINNYHGSKGFNFQATPRFFSDPQTVAVGPTGSINAVISSTIPVSSSAGGTVGNLAISGSYLYINNGSQWYRVAVSSF